MSELIAWAWLGVVGAALAWLSIRFTDRLFWQVFGIAAGFCVIGGITGWALAKVAL